ncbi:MAG: hypothetical protein O9320_01920 [Magnetospirillum sp.]|nr:hypothetical protein [Magnetospirillum sp.]
MHHIAPSSSGALWVDPQAHWLRGTGVVFPKILDKALCGIEALRERYASLQKLSESAVRVLACFRSASEQRLTPAGLMAETGLVRRTVQNVLVALLKAGLIQRLGAGRGTRCQLIF